MTIPFEKLLASKDATIDAIDVAYLERCVRKQKGRRRRIAWLAVLAAVLCGVITSRVSRADDIIVSGGTLLNNHEPGRSTSPYVELTARMGTSFKGLEAYGTFTHVFQSAFGGHEGKGSAQIVSVGLMKPWTRGQWELRAGVGLLAAVHYDWGSHYQEPMTNETYKAECLLCGWTVPLTLSRGPAELSLIYVSTDPNFWTSWNGARLGLGWRF